MLNPFGLWCSFTLMPYCCFRLDDVPEDEWGSESLSVVVSGHNWLLLLLVSALRTREPSIQSLYPSPLSLSLSFSLYIYIIYKCICVYMLIFILCVKSFYHLDEYFFYQFVAAFFFSSEYLGLESTLSDTEIAVPACIWFLMCLIGCYHFLFACLQIFFCQWAMTFGNSK